MSFDHSTIISETNFLKNIVHLGKSIEFLENPADICRQACLNITQSLFLPDNVIYLRSEQNRYVQVVASGNKFCPQVGVVEPISLEPGQGIVGTVAQESKALKVADTRQLSSYIVDDQERLSELAVPICYQGEVFGVIDAEHPQLNFFDDNHLLYMEGVSLILAPHLANIYAKQHLKKSNLFFPKQKTKHFIFASKSENFKDMGDSEDLADVTSMTVDSLKSKIIKNKLTPTICLDLQSFSQAISHWLKNYHQFNKLKSSPLLRSILVNSEQSVLSVNQKILHINRSIERSLLKMQDNQATQLLAKIIRRSYIESNLSQQMLADELNMAYSTFRRYQTEAKQHLSNILWCELEYLEQGHQLSFYDAVS